MSDTKLADSYSLPTLSLTLGKRHITRQKKISREDILSFLAEARGTLPERIEQIPAERALCFHLFYEDGSEFFLKIFYSRRDPSPTIELADKTYLACKISSGTLIKRLSGRAYISLTPWLSGEPLIKAGFSMTDGERRDVGGRVAKMLTALHSLPPSSLKKLKRASLKSKLRAGYFLLKLSHIKDEGAWELYRFAKKHIKALNGMSAPCHLDLHLLNILCDRESKKYTLIDFGEAKISHPWRDFAIMLLFPEEFRAVAVSMLYTYFGGEIPPRFWEINAVSLALYVLSCTPASEEFVRAAREIIGSPNFVPPWWRAELEKHINYTENT